MVSLNRATTTCVVQKEKTQTRITFNNLSASLTVSDLYKYVQLHLDEERPFELALVPVGGRGSVDLELDPSGQKVSLADKKQETLLAAGLNFENGVANTIILTSSADCASHKYINHCDSNHEANGQGVAPLKSAQLATIMVVPDEKSDDPINGTTNGRHTPGHQTNGHKPPHTEPVQEEGAEDGEGELTDFSRQITIDTATKDADNDPAPLVSPIELSPPAASNPNIPEPPPLPALEYPSTAAVGPSPSSNHTARFQSMSGPSSTAPKFVGLVNQAMTCYLNSLLQALYMTPEFRNALYNWEFDGQDETKSIPYQLQRLFLNLQTSPKPAVETTDLTRSFGWDSSEAWQQHDIQELCRVMFDALEHKFKHTKESNLINRLYEGKMVDYLKCLSCGTEKQREDTFLDIPLPVKPFGSTVAFESIEEALRAFIQPEILNGNNQYNCDKCQKKCDAHKGLKFSKFPYILTLHLKRFDFDYQTFHRIKLNDKVTFPQTLDLNGFVDAATEFSQPETANGHAENGHGAQNGERGDARQTFGSHSGPYLYELFAIMIHSGSASGGHYYVYIKDFESGHWFCFNDQCVSAITQDDIVRSFGGGAGRYHYSGAYTTSTNAYMLMYRQLDPARNRLPTKVEDFPAHIVELQARLKDRQELDTRRRNTTDCGVITTRVYHYDRERCKLNDVKIHISGDYYLDELLQRAYDRMNLATTRSLNLCRLVVFNSRTEETLASVGAHEQTLLQDVLDKYPRCDFLIEERSREGKFREYVSPMLNARVYVVELSSGHASGPVLVPVQLSGTVLQLKQDLARQLNIGGEGGDEELRVALSKGNVAVVLEDENTLLDTEIDPSDLCPVKFFVAPFPETARRRAQKFDARLRRIVERFDQVMSLYFKVPHVTPKTRKLFSIPDYTEPVTNVGATTTTAAAVEAVTDQSATVEAVLSMAGPLVDDPIASPVNGSVSTMSSTPEPPSSASPEPPEASVAEVVKPKIKKKALVPKSSSPQEAEKSPVRTIETTKEVTENGVTKKVRVIKRIVKKDPAKKAAAAVAEDSLATTKTSDNRTSPSKVVKRVKVAAVEPVVEQKPVEVVVTSPAKEVEELQPIEVVVTLPKPKIASDPFAFLDGDGPEEESAATTGTQYFAVVPKRGAAVPEQNGGHTADSETRLIHVHVDKGMTVNRLKQHLESVLQVSRDFFKINRSQTETLRHSDTVGSLSEGEEFSIELGRILQDGEYKYRVSFLKLSAVSDFTEELEPLCEFIVCNNQRVDEAKRGILEYIHQTGGHKAIEDTRPESYRLWTKMYQSLSQACTDDVVLGDDVPLRRNGEFVLQQLEEGRVEPMSSSDDFVIFVRKWNPDTLVLEPYEAISLPLKSELTEKLSTKTGIPKENLEYARNMAPFPKMKISRANINVDMDWRSEPLRTSYENSRYGHVYFYRDKTVSARELSAQEVAAIQQEETSQREAARASLNGGRGGESNGGGDSVTAGLSENGSSVSAVMPKNRRKERALKIYLDSSPAKVSS